MIRSSISRLLTILSEKVRKTNWWNNRYALVGQFMPQPLFRALYVRNYESLCIGGESAAFAIQIENGLNLSSGKTTIQLVFDIIKFYHSYLRKKGKVLVSLSPLEFIKQPELTYIDYSRFIKPLPIEEKKRVGDYYSPVICLLDSSQLPTITQKYYYRPYLYEPWKCLKSLIYDEKKDDRQLIDAQLIDSDKLEKMANSIVKKQLSELNFDNQESTLRSIVDFCKERDYSIVLLINPINDHLAKRIPADFYVFVEKISHIVEVWDYSQDTEFMDDSLYQGVEIMNRKGRELFSKRVENRIKESFKYSN